MKRRTWEKKIREACEKAGTYRSYFDMPIEALAVILERRDDAERKYIESGEEPVIEYVNKAGAKNMVKNPALVVWDDMNKSALAYWRDLGLTPAGLRKIDEDAMKQKKKTGLAEVLKDLGG